MDIVDTVGGQEVLVDITFTDVCTVDASRLAARLRWDGAAARKAEDWKRRRYPVPEMVPGAIESGGRMGTAGLEWLRRVYAAAEAQEQRQRLLRELSAHAQATTAAIQR